MEPAKPEIAKYLPPRKDKSATDKFLAAKIGDTEWLEQSINSKNEAKQIDKNGFTPIHYAALHGQLDCLKMLIEKYKVDPNIQTAEGMFPLILCIKKELRLQSFKCVQYLIRQGADVNCKSADNSTAIHQAAKEGLLDCLHYLLLQNGPVFQRDRQGHTAFDIARIWGNKKCARYIQNKIWSLTKHDEAVELKKLSKLKMGVCNLQQEALQQMQNDRDFFSGITFDNWMDDKGYEDFPTKGVKGAGGKNAVEGLSRRIQTSGNIEDFAGKMERVTEHFNKQNKQYQKSRKGSVYKKSQKQQGELPKVKQRKSSPTPKFSYNLHDKTLIKKRGKYWDFSTNVDSPPTTDIKQKMVVSLGVHPQEMPYKLIPFHVNLPVRVLGSRKVPPSVKICHPGGDVRDADIEIPKLPPWRIWGVLSANASGRLVAPTDFRPTHISDVNHKRTPGIPLYEEVAMHLKISDAYSAVQRSPADPRPRGQRSQGSLTASTTTVEL